MNYSEAIKKLTNTKEWYDYYYKKYGSFRVQLFIGRPNKWENYEPINYPKMTYAFPNHRERMIDEIIIDFDGKKPDSITHGIAGFERFEKRNLECSLWESGGDGAHCLPIKEQVFVKIDEKVKKIELRELHRVINSGKEVRINSPNGFIKVLASTEREQKPGEKLTRITLSNGLKITSSGDHQHLIEREGKTIIVEAQEVLPSDYMFVAKQYYPGENLGTWELGYFLGLYLADGYSGKKNHINFCFHKEEKDLGDFVESYAKKLGGRTHRIYEDNYQKINIFSNSLYGALQEFTKGKLAKDKGFTNRVFNMSVKFREGILEGWFAGDGLHEQKQNGESISKGLAKDMQKLSLTVGIISGLHNYNLSSPMKGKRYRVHLFKEKDFEKQNPYSWKKFRIKEVRRTIKKKTRLIDLQVDSEDSLFYLSNGIVTHNCHIFFPELKNLNIIARETMIEVIKKTILEGLIRPAGLNSHVCQAKPKLYQAELAHHRKGGSKELIISHTTDSWNRIPADCWKNYNIRIKKEIAEREERKHSPTINNEGVPEFIKYFQSENYYKTNEGKKRAAFIMASYFGTQEPNREYIISKLREWNSYVLRNGVKDDILESVTKSVMQYHANEGIRLPYKYAKQLLEELGRSDIKTYNKIIEENNHGIGGNN